MASFVSVSQTELGRRRQQLRRQRRWKSAQSLWQIVAVSTLAGGLLWSLTQPIWSIAQPEQVKVEGNEWLSDQAIRSMLSLTYPQSVWGIQPQALEKQLQSKGSITQAKVTRHLLPPSLTVEVQERLPVAIAQKSRFNSGLPNTFQQPGATEKPVWLDAQGGAIPLETYQLDRSLRPASHASRQPLGTGPTQSLPTLKVIGPLERYQPYWSQFYQALSRSPVKVFEVDWQNSGNLILTTELGKVHLGPYSSQLPEQLRLLDRMRQLPKQVNPGQIAYIDLKNPAAPTLHLPPGKNNSES